MNARPDIVALLLTLTAAVPAGAVNLGGVDVPKDRFIVFLFIGHSNMCGRVDDIDTETYQTHPRAWNYKFEDGTNAWIPAQPPLHRDVSWQRGGGPGTQMLKRLVEMYPGYYFGAIQNAHSSVTIQADYRRGRGLYDEIVAQALPHQNDVTFGGVVAMLGFMESGNAGQAADFANQLNGMMGEFRQDLGMPDLPLMIHQLSRGRAQWQTIRDQITSVTSASPFADTVPSDGPYKPGDDVHFTWVGQKSWGRAAAGLVQSNGWFPFNPASDIYPPRIASARAVDATTAEVVFGEPLDPTSAGAIGNYAIAPSLIVSGASLGGDAKTVTLTTATMNSGTSYTLTVNGVEDLSGNAASGAIAGFDYDYVDIPYPDLDLWVRADSGLVKDSAGFVPLWADRSGSGNDLIKARFANQPLWLASAVNGEPALRFGGSHDVEVDWLDRTLSSTHVGDSTLFIVSSLTALGQPVNSTLFCTDANGGSNASYQIDVDGNNPGTLRLYSSQAYDFGAATTDFEMLTVRVAGTSLELRRDGASTGSFAIGASEAKTYAEYVLGRNRSSGEFLQVDVAEVLLYHRALPAGERQQVEQYLGNRYGLVGGTPGVIVAPTAGLTTSEAGGTASFDVNLNTAPVASVTVPVSSSDLAEGSLSTAALTFDTGDWSVPQTVVLTGVDDDIDDGDAAYFAVLGPATSADPDYDGLDPTDVSVTNVDDDTAGVSVSPTSGLLTTEGGGQDSFAVLLDSRPLNDVTIVVSSDDTSEGSVAPGSLTFGTGDWNQAQTVTVTGVDDAAADGNVGYTVVLAAATSSDPSYNGLDPTDVAVTNQDDDSAGITVSPTAGLVTTEAGGQDSFTVVLNTAPVSDVTVGITSGNPAEGTAAPVSLTFGPGDWDQAQTVTVTGVDDAAVDGDIGYTVLLAPATSADAAYQGIDPADVSVTNRDNDSTQNQPPVAIIAGPAATTVGAGVTYFGGNSTDDGTIVDYAWDLGDGSTDSGALVNTSFGSVGVFTVTLTVTDDGGLQDQDTLDVDVTPTLQPDITLHYPVGGEIFDAGTVVNIRWTAVDLDDARIDFSSDGGATWQIVDYSDRGAPGWEDFPWTVPDIESDRCVILVQGYDFQDPTESGLFTIQRGGEVRSIDLSSPVGGEVLTGGSVERILWTAENVTSVVVEYSLDDGQRWDLVAGVDLGDAQWGDLGWTVPNVATTVGSVRVRTDDGSVEDSSGPITIEYSSGVEGALEVTRVRVGGRAPAGVDTVRVGDLSFAVSSDGLFEAEVDLPAGVESAVLALEAGQGAGLNRRTLRLDLGPTGAPPIDGLAVSASEIQAFLGGRSGVLAWVDAGSRVQVLDLRDPEPAVRLLSDDLDCVNPLISPDGTRVVYSRGMVNGPKTIYVRDLQGGSPAQQVAIGDLGYWVFDNGEEHVVYCDWSDKTSNGGGGSTYRQKLSSGGTGLDGAAEVLLDRAMDAGPNADLSWLGQVYDNLLAHEMTGDIEYATSSFFLIDGSPADHQTCNGSMAPDAGARLMALVIPHDYVRIYTHDAGLDRFEETTRFLLPEGMVEWEFPEWSTDPGYFSAVLRAGDYRNRLFLVKVGEGMLVPERLEITGETDNVSFNHLYVAP